MLRARGVVRWLRHVARSCSSILPLVAVAWYAGRSFLAMRVVLGLLRVHPSIALVVAGKHVKSGIGVCRGLRVIIRPPSLG